MNIALRKALTGVERSVCLHQVDAAGTQPMIYSETFVDGKADECEASNLRLLGSYPASHLQNVLQELARRHAHLHL